jgi:proteasome assembly chaperone (PAC2) family protein
MTLYRLERGNGSAEPALVEPTLIAAFDGWVDAGSAATVAADHIAGEGHLVASFDADALYDYRARRPTLAIVDGRPGELTWPELRLRRGRVSGRDVLVLSGPEPDFRWHELTEALVEIAHELGVAEWVSLGAIPAGVPHTRPVPLLGTESRAGLLRGDVNPGPPGVLRVPAAAISVIDIAVSEAGLPAVGYFAQVPHYVSGPYPEASIALVRAVGRHLGAEIPVDALEEEARTVRTRLDAAVAVDEATRTYVERLEVAADETSGPSSGDLIGEIERFLRSQGSGGDLPN